MKGLEQMDAAKFIEDMEGNRLQPYHDSEGYLTIGVGIMIDERKGGGLTYEESIALFKMRLRKVELEVEDRFPRYRSLSKVRKAVLLSMAYQMGVNGLLGFKKMLAHIQQKDFYMASCELMDSRFADQTPNRAAIQAMMLQSNLWPGQAPSFGGRLLSKMFSPSKWG